MRSVYCEQLTNVIMRSVYVLGTMDKCLYFRSIYGEQWTNVIMRFVYCVVCTVQRTMLSCTLFTRNNGFNSIQTDFIEL